MFLNLNDEFDTFILRFVMELPKSQGKPPGRKVIKRMPARTKWILLTVAGVICAGVGVFVLATTALYKYNNHPASQWVILVLYGMVLLSSGILILGQAFRFRILIDVRREARRNIRSVEKKMQDKIQDRMKVLAKEVRVVRETRGKSKEDKKEKGTDK